MARSLARARAPQAKTGKNANGGDSDTSGSTTETTTTTHTASRFPKGKGAGDSAMEQYVQAQPKYEPQGPVNTNDAFCRAANDDDLSAAYAGKKWSTAGTQTAAKK